MLRAEHEALKVEYEQDKQKVKCFQMHLLLAGVCLSTHCESEIWYLDSGLGS